MYCSCPICLLSSLFPLFCPGLWCDSPDTRKILIKIEKVPRLNLKLEEWLLQIFFKKGEGPTNKRYFQTFFIKIKG